MSEGATSSSDARVSTGIEELDRHLGGGLFPGRLALVVGATGIGKTQLGIQFLGAGSQLGCLLDLSSRGDAQNHLPYASRILHHELTATSTRNCHGLRRMKPTEAVELASCLNVLESLGKRPVRESLAGAEWDEWQRHLNQHLSSVLAFVYHHLVRGARRIVIDGFEPARQHADSLQFEIFEYVYQHAVRKDPMWLARDVFREKFLEFKADVEATLYQPDDVASMALCTSNSSMLDDLISEPLTDNDHAANANTLIYMGKVRDGFKMRRAIYIAKHRGSPCSEEIIPFEIVEGGLEITS